MKRCNGCAKPYETACGVLDDTDGKVKPACPFCNALEGTSFDDYSVKIARIDGRDVNVSASAENTARARMASATPMQVMQAVPQSFTSPTSTNDILATMRSRRGYLEMKIAEADACKSERRRLDKMIRAAERVVAEERLDAERASMAAASPRLEN